MRVLLIEDHKPLCRALRQGLEEEGFAVDVAGDGEEGDFKARSANSAAVYSSSVAFVPYFPPAVRVTA